MVHILLLWQVGLFEVIIRQTHGRLHQRSPAIVVLIERIRRRLRRIVLAFGRL